MILCLAAAHASIFNTPRQAFFRLNQRVKLFCSFVNFYQLTFLATFYLFLLHLSVQILTLEIHSFNHYGIFASAKTDIN